MQELSLNILDITDNSIKAKAELINIDVMVEDNVLTIRIKDNGCGMSEEFLQKATDPYSTTRKTRNVGLGIPFFKMEAELSGGTFDIQSKLGVGTIVTATFLVDSIDRPPLGDLAETMVALVPACATCDIILTFGYNGEEFVFDTRELKEQLGGADSLEEPFVLQFIREMIQENIQSIIGGAIL